jgi:hypothetical protein
MPAVEALVWIGWVLVALNLFNMAVGIFELTFGRPSKVRRVALRVVRRTGPRIPATPRDWRLYGTMFVLASGAGLCITTGLLTEVVSAPAHALLLQFALVLLTILLGASAVWVMTKIHYFEASNRPNGQS